MANTNSLNSGSLEELQPGETLFVQLIKTATEHKDQYQLEFAEIIERGARSGNLLAAMNDGDNRFTSGKPRRGWMTCTLKGFCKMFGLDPKEVKSKNNKTVSNGKTAYVLNILNPVFSDKGATKQFAGERARLELVETTTPNDWQAANYERSAKQVNGEFITHNGMAIFANTSLVPYEPEHIFLESDRVINNNDNEPIMLKGAVRGGKLSTKKSKKSKKTNPFADLDS